METDSMELHGRKDQAASIARKATAPTPLAQSIVTSGMYFEHSAAGLQDANFSKAFKS